MKIKSTAKKESTKIEPSIEYPEIGKEKKKKKREKSIIKLSSWVINSLILYDLMIFVSINRLFFFFFFYDYYLFRKISSYHGRDQGHAKLRKENF